MGRDVLCPVALDDSCKNSPWPKRVMEQVMESNILDFLAWEDDGKFWNTFNKLSDGLELFYKGEVMANEEQLGIDPLPGLPPNRRTDLGEGECAVFMEPIILVQVEITPPPIGDHNWGRAGSFQG